MSKTCPNCYFENESDGEYCQDCGSILDITMYIESKKFDKNLSEKIKSLFGKRKIDNINAEIEDFINFSQDFKDFDTDSLNVMSNNFNKDDFKEKYKIISKLDDFKYLDEIIKDEDLNEKLLFLKQVKTYISNFDEEIDKLNKLVSDIELKTNDIDVFRRDLDELLESDDLLEISNKNDLVQVHKITFDFFNRDKVRKLNIKDKDKIQEFLDLYNNLDDIIEEHNEEIKIKNHDKLILKSSNKAHEFLDYMNHLKESEDFIPSTLENEIKKDYQEDYDNLKNEDISKLNLSVTEKSDVSKFLKDFHNVDKIIDKINEELSIKILQNKLDDNLENLNQFNNDLEYLLTSDFYITFKQKDEIIECYQDLYDLACEAAEKMDLSEDYQYFVKHYPFIEEKITIRNQYYVEDELIKHEKFFDNIDGKSLDENQRLAVVKNDLNTQIIAGAGCGKTLTVNAKVKYLIEKKDIDPSEILCLSFSNLSVGDLKEKLPEGIEIATFHKLGGKILRSNDKPSRPSSEALDNFIKIYFRDNIINNEKICEDLFNFYAYYFYTNIEEEDADSLGEVYDIEESRDFKTLRNLYGGDNKKITFKNEEVKSFEELVIANYLFAHQIDYTYEKTYEVENKNYLLHKRFVYDLFLEELNDFPELQDILFKDYLELFEVKQHVLLNDYNPDFYLDENEIYLEHFGVNRNCQARWLSEEESKEYTDGIKWKRNLHRTYGSKLIETYSYYMSEDRLLQRLEEKLKKQGVEIKEIDYVYLISKITERNEVNKFKDLIKLIKNFIELFKGNNFTIDKFNEFKVINQANPRLSDRKRVELFLNIVEDIYISYQNYLKEIKKIDFNDMINNATAEVLKGNLQKYYKYIIVDEYQDTSYTRYSLVKAIQDVTGAKVCVVGDDWQSIYRFTGCNVALFTKFEEYFENPDKLSIQTTYRNSQQLIDISGRFINKNPNQIKKSLKSKKEPAEKPVKVIYYIKKSVNDQIASMEYLIDKISKESDKIMILGRNNFDINTFIDDKSLHDDNGDVYRPFIKGNGNQIIYKKNKDLKIEFITVHRSKGLEEDNVILINLENKRSGFPNQIDDDPLLDFVISDADQYEFGEERRLFYVALTRTKNNVYLLAPDTDKSKFVLELEENIDDLEILKKQDELAESLDNPEDFMKDKKVHSIKTHLKCPVCKTGDVSLVLLNKGSKSLIKFFSCSHEKCNWDGGFYYSDLELLDEAEICPECGSVMAVKNGRYGPFYSCSNRCKTPKLTGEKLQRVNKIIEGLESNIEFETYESDLDCPKCGEGKVTLKINPITKQKKFGCSNDECLWDGGKTTVNVDELDKIQSCPLCDGVLFIRNGIKGKFYGCSNYPKCRFTKDINEDSKSEEVIDERNVEMCPKCGSKLIKRNGKRGPFWGCSAFPKCRYTKDIADSSEPKTVNTIESDDNLCPKCGSKLVKRNGKFGPFWGCSAFPKCRYTKKIK